MIANVKLRTKDALARQLVPRKICEDNPVMAICATTADYSILALDEFRTKIEILTATAIMSHSFRVESLKLLALKSFSPFIAVLSLVVPSSTSRGPSPAYAN